MPIGLSGWRIDIDEPDFRKCIDQSKFFALKGSGGCGKSILMKHLFITCLSDSRYVPILVELRDLNDKINSLEDLILEILDKFDFDIKKDYYIKAKEHGHFCFLLDGYDEVISSKRPDLIADIKTLADKYPKCPIVISSRPDDIFDGLNQFSIYNLKPLSKESRINLIDKLPYDEKIKINFINEIKSNINDKHESFLSNPLLISIMLLTYGEYTEIPHKSSIFYELAYEVLFQRHDGNKGGFSRERKTDLDIKEFAKVFSIFSLQTYDGRRFKFTKIQCLEYLENCREILEYNFVTENYLDDAKVAACLLLEDSIEISYTHRSFQEYFVAKFICEASTELQLDLLSRYWKRIRSDNVIGILYEMNNEVIEKNLFIPQFEELFRVLRLKGTPQKLA